LLLKKKNYYKALYFTVPFLLVLSFWLPVLRNQMQFGLKASGGITGWSAVLGRPTLKNLALLPVKFILGRISFNNRFLYYLTAAMSVFMYAFLLLTAFLKLELIKKYFLMGWLLIPVTAGFLISFITPLFSYFRFLYILPAVYLLAAAGVDSLPGEQKKWLKRFLVVLNILFLILFYKNPANLRENWKGAVEYIKTEQKQVLAYKEFTEPLEYYSGEYTTDVEELNKDTVLFVTYGESIIDPEHERKLKLKNKGYNYQGVTNFNGVTVEEWRHR
jgi:hypothetical protein